jgi:hypothetical protein
LGLVAGIVGGGGDWDWAKKLFEGLDRDPPGAEEGRRRLGELQDGGFHTD